MSAVHVPDPSPKHPGRLPRVLGPFDAVTVVIGSIIGSGIFFKPEEVADKLGYYGFGAIISVWILVGMVTLFGSLALAELAAMLPHAGGPYVYLREAYGRLPAFLWGWTEFWIVRTGSLGALAVATVMSLNKIQPMPLRVNEAVAIAIVVVLSAVNMISTRWGAHVQNVTVVIKVGFIAAVTLLPFLWGQFSTENLHTTLPQKPPETADQSFWMLYGAAMIAVLWPYDGWINIGPVAEEIRDPQRNIPRALLWGTIVVMLTYVGANVAYHLVLPMDQVSASDGVAADAFATVVGPTGAAIVAIGIMCSTFGAVNSNMLTGPRIYFAIARDGLLPASIRKIHGRYETPYNAILIQAAWTIVLILVAYDLADVLTYFGAPDTWIQAVPPKDAFDTLTDFVIFGGQVFYAMAVGAVFVLRWKKPQLHRPYRTWGYPVLPAIYLLVFAFAAVSMFYTKQVQTYAGSTLILAGVAFYYWARRRVAAES